MHLSASITETGVGLPELSDPEVWEGEERCTPCIQHVCVSVCVSSGTQSMASDHVAMGKGELVPCARGENLSICFKFDIGSEHQTPGMIRPVGIELICQVLSSLPEMDSVRSPVHSQRLENETGPLWGQVKSRCLEDGGVSEA